MKFATISWKKLLIDMDNIFSFYVLNWVTLQRYDA